jgi:uncharacterized membrane protein (DUF4010 family)
MAPLSDQLTTLGLSAALGLLVGLQREFAGNSLAGIRTFPLFAVLGTLCAMLAPHYGLWLVAAGLVAMSAMLVMGNLKRRDDEGSGLTTEIAAMVMYLMGVWVVEGSATVAVVVAGTLAVLLHLKKPMHDFVKRIGPSDIKAVMQFIIISLVILPLLPSETYGPYQVLNPRTIWWMVVLIVGVELAAYILYRWFGEKAGTFLGGILGGLVSSTATTVAFARRARHAPEHADMASIVITLASTVAFVRVLVLAAFVAPFQVSAISWPLAIMVGVLFLIVVFQTLGSSSERVNLPESKNPAELRPALIFAAIYAVVTVGIAAANDHFGTGGLYVVAIISGLTDMDAVTLSSARMMADNQLSADLGWRVILIAGLANLVFKGGAAFILGGAALGRRIAIAFGIAFIIGTGLVVFWPSPTAPNSPQGPTAQPQEQVQPLKPNLVAPVNPPTDPALQP